MPEGLLPFRRVFCDTGAHDQSDTPAAANASTAAAAIT
jgi:hypothetical protein